MERIAASYYFLGGCKVGTRTPHLKNFERVSGHWLLRGRLYLEGANFRNVPLDCGLGSFVLVRPKPFVVFEPHRVAFPALQPALRHLDTLLLQLSAYLLDVVGLTPVLAASGPNGLLAFPSFRVRLLLALKSKLMNQPGAVLFPSPLRAGCRRASGIPRPSPVLQKA